ncbi:RES family NAD+ phosphorylase [Ralstonia solanacearum]|uniref:RES family NAD+ phosphorylase n=1 Tax=Ralstonia solanacearum TaxID=305 RepID=UPI0005C576BB|nr:RES family NAD+ phosphorylase [Ralstonia solanacearum]MDB0543937.1 RES family NAD+ phosphorylase [Ralstonia solanacearum]MDB0553799.1 RES family NAD+ phosphorylase [Ralstonia solanacearum]MDB0558875.1 RES family NAD+ phosphorylase [Ralstonia solanacearum]
MRTFRPDLKIPSPYVETLPSLERLRQALEPSITVLPAGASFFRAVTHPAAVIPPYVQRTYRFGPPDETRGSWHSESYPFFWLYAAADMETALWEAQFCRNDMTQPGTFYIPDTFAADGLIAEFTLQQDVPVLMLGGTEVSRLGISERINGEHAWCQWFGVRLDEMLASWAQPGQPLGFIYPSRRHKNHNALAINSDALNEWRRSVGIRVTPFTALPIYEALRAAQNYAAPLAGGFSIE